jgi:hypothetical protein
MILAAALLPLLAAWAVTFTEDAHIPDGDATYEGQPVTVSGCTLTVDDAHVFTNLYLVNSATLTHTAGSAGMTLTVSGTVSVATGSKIDVTACGSGPRAGTEHRAGGSHGGRGEPHDGSVSCAVYGDAFAPTHLGSGGYSTTRGGGAVRITADTLQLDGTLLANGQNGANYNGGGSGGSIWLDVGTLQGSGSIQANGGLHANSPGDSGDGGGGRVAVYYYDASGFDLTAIQCAAINDGAGAGTVYLKDNAEPFGRLTLDNEARSHSTTIPSALTVGSNRFDRLSVSGEACLDLTATNLLTLSFCVVSNAFATFSGDVAGPALTLIDGDWTHGGDFGFSNSVVLSGASTLRHSVGYPTGLRITADSVTVSSSSAIDVSARGSGVRVGTMDRAGGSYGGRGEPHDGRTSCEVYGDAFAPAELGSGGNGGKACRGGGAVRITVDALQLDGILHANGQNGADYTGGGSGGSIWLEVGTLQGTGSIQANGGLHSNSPGDSGDGGGGRVAVYYDDASGFDLTSTQCAAINDGAGAGTVYLKDNAEPFGQLMLNNGDHGHSTTIPSALTVGSNRFDRLSVSGEACLDLTATNLLTLSFCVVSNAFATFSGDVAGPALTLIDGDWTHGGDFGFSNSVVLSGASTLRHPAGYPTGLRITADSVSVSSDSVIDVTACGSGPRAGTTYRSGGSYGGRGEPWPGSTSCAVYGDAFEPVDLGSGGNGYASRGGGAVRITADALQLDGILRANGQNGADYTGGGSGGSVWLDVGTLQGAGSIHANGGLHGRDASDGGGGRVAVYAQNTEDFSPLAVEALADTGAEWGTVFMGVPRTVAVTCTGQGVCDPTGPVVIPYGGTNTFAFTPTPVLLATNGTDTVAAATFEWVNTGLWRGTLADSAWLEKLNGSDTLEAAFEALAAKQAAAQPGGGMAVAVNGLAGWRYTLERRESLTEGEWTPVTGQIDVLCDETGPLILTDATVLPQAFYRVVAAP